MAISVLHGMLVSCLTPWTVVEWNLCLEVGRKSLRRK